MQKITFRKVKHFKWQQPAAINYILCIDGKKTKYYICKSNLDFDNYYRTYHLLDENDYNYEAIINKSYTCRFEDLAEAKAFMVEYLNRESNEVKDIF